MMMEGQIKNKERAKYHIGQRVKLADVHRFVEVFNSYIMTAGFDKTSIYRTEVAPYAGVTVTIIDASYCFHDNDDFFSIMYRIAEDGGKRWWSEKLIASPARRRMAA